MAQAAVAGQGEAARQPDAKADGRSGALKKPKVVVLMPKDGMITITGKEGDPDNHIPQNSDYKVWSMPDDIPVSRGRVVGGVLKLQLDYGRYRIKVKKMKQVVAGASKAISYANWGYEFIVGMSEPDYRKLEAVPLHWKPASVMTTENSGAEIKCGMPGCEHISMTHVGAVVHEFQAHFRLDPIKATMEELEKAPLKAI